MKNSELIEKAAEWRAAGKKIAFTNGCFDIIHAGHIASLTEAAKHGDILIVGLNSDSSTRRLKGENRPINDEQSRALVLASLMMVDAVTLFSEPTPRDLIVALKPDFLIKGGDYTVDKIAGATEVIENGGKVIINSIVPGFSTSSIIEKINKL